MKGKNNPNWTGGKIKFNCEECGTPCERKPHSRIKNNFPKYCSLQCAAKVRARFQQGKNHWNWKGGCLRYQAKIAPRPKPTKCEICGVKSNALKKGLAYDHDHKTDKFRGWLCGRCNTALGMVNDNIDILKKLIRYIRKSNKNLL